MRRRKVAIGTLVHIRWEDSSEDPHWKHEVEAPDTDCDTVGFVTDTFPKTICVSHTITRTAGEHLADLGIPWRAIVWLQPLSTPTPTLAQERRENRRHGKTKGRQEEGEAESTSNEAERPG